MNTYYDCEFLEGTQTKMIFGFKTSFNFNEIKKGEFYVYMITNLINNKKYIGCSSDLVSRIRRHSKGKFCGSTLLYKSINKYGKENFSVSVISRHETKEDMLSFEIKDIKDFDSLYPNGYNLHHGGKGGKIKLSEEQKIKRKEVAKRLSIINKGNKYNVGRKLSDETKKKLSEINKGKVMSAESRLKLSNSKKGISTNKGIVRSEEYKKKMSEIKKGVVFSEETKIKMSLAAKERVKKSKRSSTGRFY